MTKNSQSHPVAPSNAHGISIFLSLDWKHSGDTKTVVRSIFGRKKRGTEAQSGGPGAPRRRARSAGRPSTPWRRRRRRARRRGRGAPPGGGCGGQRPGGLPGRGSLEVSRVGQRPGPHLSKAAESQSHDVEQIWEQNPSSKSRNILRRFIDYPWEVWFDQKCCVCECFEVYVFLYGYMHMCPSIHISKHIIQYMHILYMHTNVFMHNIFICVCCILGHFFGSFLRDFAVSFFFWQCVDDYHWCGSRHKHIQCGNVLLWTPQYSAWQNSPSAQPSPNMSNGISTARTGTSMLIEERVSPNPSSTTKTISDISHFWERQTKPLEVNRRSNTCVSLLQKIYIYFLEILKMFQWKYFLQHFYLKKIVVVDPPPNTWFDTMCNPAFLSKTKNSGGNSGTWSNNDREQLHLVRWTEMF